jgi:NCAIR mutase (PurE)-related protein
LSLSRDVKLDLGRAERLGLDEAIFCGPKTIAHLIHILDQASEAGAGLLLTRLAPEQVAGFPPRHRDRLDYEPISRTGFFGTVREAVPGTDVAIVAAGTSDAGVAREAARSLRFHGVDALEVGDVGVAGLWRLLERLDELRRASVVIAVAGMDAALPTVIGGLVAGVVIGVPTSVGYGVAAGGETALRAMLASCAPGLMVMNIDNGYGAACAALRILRVSRPGPRPDASTA